MTGRTTATRTVAAWPALDTVTGMRSRQQGPGRSDAYGASDAHAGSGRWGWTHRYGVHLLVASVVAVVIAGGGLVAALILGGGEPQDCVVGRWRVVTQDQEMSVGEFRLVGEGPLVEYRADGTGFTDYGDGVAYTFVDTALFGAGSTDVVVSGVVYHDYVQVGAGQMRYANLRSEATMAAPNGLEITHELSDEPFDYTCEGDVLTQRIEDRYQARLERVDS